jgi:hypothetical protein
MGMEELAPKLEKERSKELPKLTEYLKKYDEK